MGTLITIGIVILAVYLAVKLAMKFTKYVVIVVCCILFYCFMMQGRKDSYRTQAQKIVRAM
jgi:chromate transport protein ChrA